MNLLAALLLLIGISGLKAQTVFFSDNFNRANQLDLDAATNGMAGLIITNQTLTASNEWLEPMDLGRAEPTDSAITNNTLRMGGNGHSVNIVLDCNFATVMSTGTISARLKLNGTPGPNDGTALHRYQGIGFGFSRAEGNVVSASVDRVLSRAADVFVAETADGRIRINDESPSSRPDSNNVTPTVTIDLNSSTNVFIAGTLRLDFIITNTLAGSTVRYTVLFDAGSTGSFATLTNRSFVLSGDFELYSGLEDRSTPSVVFDDFSISAIGAYGPPILTNPGDHYQVLRNSSTNVLDVLRNDGPGKILVSISQPTNGTAFITGTNVIYSPSSNYIGADSFTYISHDGLGATNISTVSLDIRQYPNFVFILADDQGWTGLSLRMDKNRPDSKSDYYRTPRMETLASQAMRFSLGYAPHPNCSPSRYSFLTGQIPARHKMTDILGRSDEVISNQFKLIAPGKAINSIQSSKVTIPELLKTIPGAGYSAAHFGKWHLGGGGPVSHGFDSDANDGATDNSDGNTGSEPINSDPKRAYTITDRASAFLDSRVSTKTPFYLQVSHYAVHETTQTSQSSYDSYAGVNPGVWHTNRYYAGMTTDLDINVGRLLDKLDDLGIRNSTYVIYQADNGAPQSQSENYPLRGYKPEVWEGGTRTPTFIRGPGVLADSQCDVPVCGIDFLPTIWHWATGSTTNLPADVDGGSLVSTIKSIAQGSNSPAPVVRGGLLVHHSPHYVGPLPWPDDWQLNPKDMRPRSTIHDGHYKLVANYEPGTIELYDLNSDIGEQTNLSADQLAIKWQLWVRLRDYLKLVQAQMPTLDPSYRGTTNGSFVLTGAMGALGDADSDGLNDDWEFRELLTYQFNGNDDPDQDGVSNAQELAQGTDPLLPNAYRIDTITQVATNQLRLTWNATPGASFAVETSTNLVTWTPATMVTAGDVFFGSATVQRTSPYAFFRVRKL